jgi:hypothetical protein
VVLVRVVAVGWEEEERDKEVWDRLCPRVRAEKKKRETKKCGIGLCPRVRAEKKKRETKKCGDI